MPSSYTSLLGLVLPVTGDLSGTWGDVVNNSLTSLLDTAIAGTTTLSTDADVTLTTTTGSANQARQAILLCSGARTGIKTITAPAQSKIYTIINATTGGYSVRLVGVGPTAGVTIVTGESAICAWNGSDFVKVSSNSSFGDLTVTSLTDTGLTAGRVVFVGTGGLLTDSANLTFNGTTLTAAGLAGPLNGTVGATTQNTGYFTALRMYGASSGYVGLQGAAAAGSTTYTLPAADGTNGQALKTNGSGTLSWGSVVSAAAGSDTQVQYNSSGSFAGSANFTFNGSQISVYGVTVGRGGGSVSTNTAVGSGTLSFNTIGAYNTSFGYSALLSNVISDRNTAVGYYSLAAATGGSNTAVGSESGATLTTGTVNVLVGHVAASNLLSGSYNVVVGSDALNGASGSGSYNVAIGQEALKANTTGSYNTAIGRNSGLYITTGTKNTILGAYNGNQNSLDIRTSNNYIVLSDGDGNPRLISDSSGNIGINTVSPGSTLDVKGTLRLSGSSSGYVGLAPAAAAGSTTYTLPASDGTNGQALTTNGSGTLTWSSPGTTVTISNDTSTATNLYPTFVTSTTGAASSLNTSNAKLLYKPSTGELQASEMVATNGIIVNSTTVSASYTIASGYNASSVGPMTINSGVTVTVSSGQRWYII